MHGKNQLKQALDEARLSNEIISAIAKSYCSIYRIDVQKDFFEEISNDIEIHKLTGNRGCASEKLYQLCDTMVSSEYRSLIRPFLDVSTLLFHYLGFNRYYYHYSVIIMGQVTARETEIFKNVL